MIIWMMIREKSLEMITGINFSSFCWWNRRLMQDMISEEKQFSVDRKVVELAEMENQPTAFCFIVLLMYLSCALWYLRRKLDFVIYIRRKMNSFLLVVVQTKFYWFYHVKLYREVLTEIWATETEIQLNTHRTESVN